MSSEHTPHIDPDKIKQAARLAKEVLRDQHELDTSAWGGCVWEHTGDALRDFTPVARALISLEEQFKVIDRLREGYYVDAQQQRERAEAAEWAMVNHANRANAAERAVLQQYEAIEKVLPYEIGEDAYLHLPKQLQTIYEAIHEDETPTLERCFRRKDVGLEP